jgi:hypothetical protein
LSRKYLNSTLSFINNSKSPSYVFCWPCSIVYQYSETNVMHFLFSLLWIKGLCMFRALLAHPQVALHKRHLVWIKITNECTSTCVVFYYPNMFRTVAIFRGLNVPFKLLTYQNLSIKQIAKFSWHL